MQFKDIIGQEEVKALILKSAREGRMPHAQLFWGGEGIGKLALALATIQYVNCEHPTDKDSCGECPSCRLISGLTHPDVHFAFPIYKIKSDRDSLCDDFLADWREMVLKSPYFNLRQWMKSIDGDEKGGTIYTAESSEISRKLSLKSLSAKYKSLIIWLPEKMQTQCANKLLKLIEEPPAGTLFFLISENPQQLLPTITSRTQALHIKNLTEDELKTVFPEDVARIAGGNIIKAREISDGMEETRQLVQRYRNLMAIVFTKDLVALKEFAEEAAASRAGTLEFLTYAGGITREAFIANLCNPELNYRTADESAFTEKFKRFVTVNNIEGIIDNITRAHRDIERNSDITLTMFDLGLQLLTLIKK